MEEILEGTRKYNKEKEEKDPKKLESRKDKEKDDFCQGQENLKIQPRDVFTVLFYGTELPSTTLNEKWFIDRVSKADGSPKTNFQFKGVEVKIQDLRGHESECGLDVTGFETLVSPTVVDVELVLSGNHDEIYCKYYPEVEKLLKKVTKADEIVFFDHTIRVNHPGFSSSDKLQQPPIQRVHVDQTPKSAHTRVGLHVQLPLSFKRFQLINVWRPIKNTVYDFPLAMADFRSLDIEKDLVLTDLIYPAWLKDKEAYYVRYNPDHRWYYWSNMTPEEVLLLKCYDSQSEKLASVKVGGYSVNRSLLRYC